MEKFTTSFYVTNFPDSLNFKDESEFLKLLSNIWIGSYHLYITTARFQRHNITGKKSPNHVPSSDTNPKIKINHNHHHVETEHSKPSFASIIHNKPATVNTKSVSLKDEDLIRVDDSSTILLLKIKEADSMSNMFMICKNEGFSDLKIHHVGGMWIWIQFPSSSSCSKFQDNAALKNYYSILKFALPSFKVDEHMIWIKISGLPLCAWGSNAFKKVACLFRKFMFFEVEESTTMSLGTWSISISDNSLDFSSCGDFNDRDKDEVNSSGI
ncbi:hypothetical protein Tco_1383745 [Tanacetum coccineum]